MAAEVEFHDPLSQTDVTLVIGEDADHTGVRHECVDGTENLAGVSAELDCAFCADCQWQCRISGAWYLDMVAVRKAIS